MATMRAVRVHSWGEAPTVDEVALPEPVDGEALIKVEAAAVAHLDRTVMGGEFGIKPDLPYVGGVEGCGTVAESAAFAQGSRVMLRGGGLGLTRDGTWAEYVRVPDRFLVSVPDGIAPALGATYFVPLTTAAAALEPIGRLGSWSMPEVDSAEDEVVIVAGAAGAVGSLVAQLALRAGSRVLGLVLDEEQAARLPEGAEALLASDGDRLAQLERERPGSLLVDTLGGSGLSQRMHWVGPGGRAVLIGYVTGENTTLDLPNWLLQDVALLPTNMIRRNQEARRLADELLPLLVSGDLTLAIQEFGFDEAARALDLLGSGQLHGRAVLVPPHD